MGNHVLLICPGDYKDQGVIPGGRSDVRTTIVGRTHCHILSSSMNALNIRMVGHSPRFRARETARIIAYVHEGVEPQEIAGLDDLDYGAWQGQALTELEGDPAWRQFHANPDGSRCPGGESLREAGARLMEVLNGLPSHQDGVIALVTHSNVIRGALAAVLGCSIDSAMRMDLLPASVTQLLQGADGGWRVGGINLRTGHNLTAATNWGRWTDRDVLDEQWAPDGESRLFRPY